ncbi:site-specific integrase [Oscillochloris sp. ZM17-4]|uniref:tyrosine-type recombinase/integrase n=1 Tax=Oscillochloris sp. ZM17-4 TaxID=2866714 RepID=UPI001C72FD1C|nr:site-specific integrase [Oscillochloris sp. ZM17-4]MBX0331328.1 site-specific integrase [Oscillochloris sp. ZM17-4]
MGRKKGRANGEGSIYEYPKDSGVWFASVTVNGKEKRRRASSQKEARELLRELQESRRAGVSLSKRQPTVKEWCESWVTTAPNLRPHIREHYRVNLARYLYKTPLARRRLDALTPAEVQGWVNDLGGRVSPGTVRNVHARLRRALAVAVKQGYTPRNVALGVELPSSTPRQIAVLDFAQARQLLAALEGDRLAMLYRLALNLGMREGELLGLTWEAIDLAAGVLRVLRQLQRIPNPDSEAQIKSVLSLQPVKTESGKRSLQLDSDLIAELRAHRAAQAEERLLLGPAWRDPFTSLGGLVFTNTAGGPLSPSDLWRHFKRAREAAGLPAMRFHDLRHTAATLMLAAGDTISAVAGVLGHSSPAITARVYAHALEESKATAIAGLSARLRKG